jgi:hypothetical protein
VPRITRTLLACHLTPRLRLDSHTNNALIIDATVPLPERNYTKDDLLLAAYMHDVDKLVCRYVADPEQPTQRQVDFARSLGIVLSLTESKKSA